MLVALPSWPAMMDLEMACAYTTLGETQFKALAALYRVSPRDLGPVRGLRWRKGDLDQMLDSLPARGEPSVEGPPADSAEAALARVNKRAGRRQ